MANTALTGLVAGAASQSEQEAGTSSTVYTSPGRQHFHPSAAKAWVNFNGTGTVAIRASYNVTSITDHNTGDYTINLTTAMADGNYVCVGSAGLIGSGARTFSLTTAFAAGSVRIGTHASGTAADLDIICVAIFGDM